MWKQCNFSIHYKYFFSLPPDLAVSSFYVPTVCVIPTNAFLSGNSTSDFLFEDFEGIAFQHFVVYPLVKANNRLRD